MIALKLLMLQRDDWQPPTTDSSSINKRAVYMYIYSIKAKGINILDLANEIDLQARHQRTYMQHVDCKMLSYMYLSLYIYTIRKNYMTISSGTSETRRVFESGNHTSCKGFIVCSAHGL